MKACGRKIAYSSVALGLTVTLLVGLVCKDGIVEKWYLWRLETGDYEAKVYALKTLAMVGTEDALIKTTNYLIYDSPYHNFTWGFPHSEAHLAHDSLVFSRVLSDVAENVGWYIERRIGKPRVRAMIFRCMKHSGTQERTKVFLAQNIILATVPLKNLPRPFRLLEEIHNKEPDRQELQEFMEVKSIAIMVLTQALSRKDKVCREGAAYGLSLCGNDAVAAVPALKIVLENTDDLVSIPSAAQALWRITGNASLVLPVLRKLLQSGEEQEKDFDSCSLALDCLSDLGSEAKIAVPEISSLLKSENPEHRCSAAIALWSINGDIEQTIPVLSKILEDEDLDELVRENAVAVLGEMGTKAVRELPKLRKLGYAKNIMLGTAAEKAVDHIEKAAARAKDKASK